MYIIIIIWGVSRTVYIYIYIIKVVTPAASIQKYYIAGGLGEEERQENTEK